MIIYPKYRVNGDIHWQHYERTLEYKKWVDWILSLFPDNDSLIDVGCGDGLFSIKLAEKGLIVTGFDISEDGIMIARRKAQKRECTDTEFWVADVEFLSECENIGRTFDYGLVGEVIEHMENGDKVVDLFRECVDDYIILTTPEKGVRGDGKIGRYHVKEYTEKEIKELFKDYKVQRLRNEELTDKEWNTNYYMVFKISK